MGIWLGGAASCVQALMAKLAQIYALPKAVDYAEIFVTSMFQLHAIPKRLSDRLTQSDIGIIHRVVGNGL